jgi:hypothetical protein
MVLTEDYTQKGVLYKLPKELRELAFKDCFTPGESGHGFPGPGKRCTATSILRALRGDVKLYNEALRVYYTANTWSWMDATAWPLWRDFPNTQQCSLDILSWRSSKFILLGKRIYILKLRVVVGNFVGAYIHRGIVETKVLPQYR